MKKENSKTNYTPTQADWDDFDLWCWMRESEERDQFLDQMHKKREQEAFL